MIVTVIIPVFNEERTIIEILKKVNSQKKFFNLQIIVSNDGSSDRTKDLLKKHKYLFDLLLNSKKNYGKGHAIRVARKKIKGKIVLIQDADLEYDPKDYKYLLNPIFKKKTNCVYGSRVLGRKSFFISKNINANFRILANFILTFLSNFLNKQNLTDVHTCYKVINMNIYNKINIFENSFSFCPELTTKLSLLKENIIEVPINYHGRSFSEGKKIRFSDAVHAITTILKVRILYLFTRKI
jgi:glycosyltransferase involved in cell wall biosynthesis